MIFELNVILRFTLLDREYDIWLKRNITFYSFRS